MKFVISGRKYVVIRGYSVIKSFKPEEFPIKI